MRPSCSDVYYVNNSHININEKSEDGRLKGNKENQIKSNDNFSKEFNQTESFCQDDFENIEDDESDNMVSEIFQAEMKRISEKLKGCRNIFKVIAKVAIITLIISYLVWCITCSKLKSEDDLRLVWVISAGFLFLTYRESKKFLPQYAGSNNISRLTCNNCVIRKYANYVKMAFITVLIIAILLYITINIALKNPSSLISISGIIFITSFCYAFSSNIRKVKWHPVINGIVVQFLIALFILKTRLGFMIFTFLGKRVEEFLQHSDAGMKFMFGNKFNYQPMIALNVFPTMIFLSSILSVLYHAGVLQFVMRNYARIIHCTIGTTAGESLNAAGNIIFGFMNAPLILKPIIGRMTKSELHAVMSSGFAAMSGNMLASLDLSGVQSVHLIAASVMSAPGALALSKLFYPETKKSKTTYKQLKKLPPSPYRNVIEAAAGGARDSITLISNIIVTTVAFVALYHLMNATLIWLGNRACFTGDLTFELIFSYVLKPLPFLMGGNPSDCKKIAELLGIKVFVGGFTAYQKLGVLIRNREIWELQNPNISRAIKLPNGDILIHNGTTNTTLFGGFMTPRSESIATYSLCGFSGISAVGMTVGMLCALVPKHRRSDISELLFRALIVGNLASCMTACIAGLFID